MPRRCGCQSFDGAEYCDDAAAFMLSVSTMLPRRLRSAVVRPAA